MIKLNIRWLILCALVSMNAYSQLDYSTVDRQSLLVPESLESYQEISAHLTSRLQTDTEKVRALYIWISHNIRYDLSQLNTGARYNTSLELVEEALELRLGVCQHYSELFAAMCNYIDIEVFVIAGYTRLSDGLISDVSHSWNAVMIDTAYYCVDATWAAGYVENNRYVQRFRDDYFMIDPDEFTRTHMPFDPIWQFSSNPINNRHFLDQRFMPLENEGSYSYRDSILLHEKRSRLKQLETSNSRIEKSGILHPLVRKHFDENVMHISYERFNRAIDALNESVYNYNRYVGYKNAQFRNPTIEDEELKILIADLVEGISFVDRELSSLVSPDESLNAQIKELRNQLPAMIEDIEREQEFVKRYLRTRMDRRPALFLAY